jgi:hypothetical protein
VILLGLIGIRDGELGECVLESRVVAEIAGDLGWLAEPGVTAGEGPPA